MQGITRWGSRRAHGMKRLLLNEKGYRVGMSHPQARIPDWVVDLVLELREAGISYGKIAAKFDDDDESLTISKSMVYKICQGLVRAQIVARVKTINEPTEVDISGWFEIGAGILWVARGRG